MGRSTEALAKVMSGDLLVEVGDEVRSVSRHSSFSGRLRFDAEESFGVEFGSDFSDSGDLGSIWVSILVISVIWGFREQGRDPNIKRATE